ncbi:MAG: SGNH/GDSL hydrolase family protein [Lactobacillus sp.]|nr:SGNH/GDSL hydrolase family protein [Lactobacillus sp.]
MKLLLTGDSIIARSENHTIPELNFQLQKMLACDIQNTAISGINSGGLALSLPNLVFNQPKCDYLIILVGTNDLATHKQVNLHQFENNLELLASSIIWLYYPERIIFITPPAVDENKQRVRSNSLVMEYGNIVKKVAREYRFSVIDLASKMLVEKNFPQIFNGKKNDGLHFGVNGYKLLANLIVQKLNQISN